MLCTRDARRYVPFGRHCCANHPGSITRTDPRQPTNNRTHLLLQTFKAFSIHDKKEFWRMQKSTASLESCDEELYASGNVVVWSRGVSDGSSQILRSFTMGSPVLEAFWCNFLIPLDRNISANKSKVHLGHNEGGATASPETSICIMESGCISFFCSNGRNYISAVPFPVRKVWVIKNGLLFERHTSPPEGDHAKTPQKREQQQASKLPVLFSLTHPLDEMAPVICKTGSSNTTKISFVTEASQQVVYTSEDPSLMMVYDRTLRLHSVWAIRWAKPESGVLLKWFPAPSIFPQFVAGWFQNKHQVTKTCFKFPWINNCLMEADFACGGSTLTDTFLSGSCGVQNMEGGGGGNTPGANHSNSAFSRYTLSSHSPSLDLSPFRSLNSKISSPSLGQSRLTSPSISRLTAFNRSQSPMTASNSLFRLHTPSPQAKGSPSDFQSPSSTNTMNQASFMDIAEPLAPEICLDHLWTETGNVATRDGSMASKVFQTSDFSGQKFLCYFINCKHQLRCLKFEESNDKSQLIFGAMSVIIAKDAAPLTNLQMMLVLDMTGVLYLYSGTQRKHCFNIPMDRSLPGGVEMNAVQVSGISSAQSLHLSSKQCNSPPGPVTSSRPPSAMDAKFDEELLHMLSPVPTEFNESSELINLSMPDELSFQSRSYSNTGCITALHDAVENRFSLELTDGNIYRTEMPEMTSSPIILSCLQALRLMLPRDLVLQVLGHWYAIHNAPGISSGLSEWQQFVSCILGMLGYDMNTHPLLRSETSVSGSPGVQLKKPRLSNEGTDEDWLELTKTSHFRFIQKNHSFLGGFPLPTPNDEPDDASHNNSYSTARGIDTTALLFPHMACVLYSLHLVYEEMRLDSVLQSKLSDLATLLYTLAKDLNCNLYSDHYCRDVPALFGFHQNTTNTVLSTDDFQKIQFPSFFTFAPPNIYQWLYSYLKKQDCLPFPCIPGVNCRTEHVIAMYVAMFEADFAGDVTVQKFIKKISLGGRNLTNSHFKNDLPPTVSEAERLVLYMTNIDHNIKDRLAPCVIIPMMEAIHLCRRKPSSDWPEAAYNLIGREDMAKQRRQEREQDDQLAFITPIVKKEPSESNPLKTTKEEDDGMNFLDDELLKLRFCKDLRIKEIKRLLQSSRPVRIAIKQRPEVSDHEFIEEQERFLYALCIRTMALPIGRGMLTLSTYHPVPTEALPIPKLCLAGRAPPRNNIVEMTHIDTPANFTNWPQFHNGVAAGLKITNTSQLESTWILFNKAKSENLTNEHAGFLMGQGLNGHLSNLATLNVHDYLIKGHEMTSMGLLLGIAADKRGTMDISTTKLLSIHIAALLPPTSTELDVPHNVQVAAVLGVGLVYQGTAHRHIAEVLLAEIGRPPGPEMENSVDRESYSLAAGLALGLVMLAKGSEVLGLSDMGMPDQLYHYMVGGQKRPLTCSYRERYKSPSYQIKEGECVNVDVTGPGATLALGLMFFNTNNKSVAEWLVAPDTQSLLDFVRPDFLLLRTISHGLIMWQSVHPTQDWVNSNLPKIVSQYAFNKVKYANDPDCDIDFETMSQAYCNIISGACMTIGLKYAGSGSKDACQCLFEILMKILKLQHKTVLVEQAGKNTVEQSLMVIILSLAMVMAGSGDLTVLRICRYLRSRIAPPVNYGSHMALAMASGLLLLGGGKYTLSTRPEAIAAMLCAFFPKFPIHTNDNRFHLQAFRHLYVLAAEKRIVIPRDVDSNKACYAKLELLYKDGRTEEITAPFMLPELDLLSEVRVKGPRYWPVEFKQSCNWDALRKILSGTGYLYVKQRAGYLSYAKDPLGYHGALAQSLSREETFGKILKSKDIESFTSDPLILAFAELYCTASVDKEFELSQLLSQLLYECTSQEKMEVLSTQISLYQSISRLDVDCKPLSLWQLKLLMAFYERTQNQTSSTRLISKEFVMSLQNSVQTLLAAWTKGSCEVLAKYFQGVELSQSNNYELLSAFLTWYRIPHPQALAQMNLQKMTSFSALFTILRPSGLSVTSIKSLSSALQSASKPCSKS